MSLVKKLQSGGSANTTLDDALNTELAAYKLKSKDERKVRDALVKLRDFGKVEGNSFSADALAKKYTISGKGSEKFEGSPDEVRSNWFTGNLKIKDDQDAMSVAAAIYGNAVKTVPSAATATSPVTREKLGIGQFDNYMINTAYGTESAFQRDFGKIQSDDERKKIIFKHAGNYIGNYLSDAAKNTADEYTDVDKVKAMQAAINAGDWNAFKEASYGVKWDPESFLTTDDDRAKFRAETEIETQREIVEKNKETLNQFIQAGFTPETAASFLEAGFNRLGELKTPTGGRATPGSSLYKHLEEKGLKVLENASGQQVIVNRTGQPVDETGESFNEFHPLSGTAWKYNPSTGFSEFVPSVYQKEDKGNIGRELQGYVPGYQGWSTTGWSGTENAPASGRDYTHTLVLTKGNEKITLTKGSDGKYYYDNGKPLEGVAGVPVPHFTGYGKGETEIYNYKELFPKLYRSDIVIPAGYDYREDLNLLNSAVQSKEAGEVYGKAGTAASKLIVALKSDPNISKNPALKKQILDLITDYELTVKGQANNDAAASRLQVGKSNLPEPVSGSMRKEGGIISAQAGSKFAEYARKVKAEKTIPTIEAGTKPAKDISGTFKDQSGFANAMDITSTAGAVASFVPGVGAIGAGVMTAADLAKDLEDGHIDEWGTHLLNAGFIGLSFVGLGGLKTLLKAGEVAGKGLNITKLASKAGKIALSPSEKLAVKEIVTLAETHGVKTTEQLLKALAGSPKNITKGIKALETIARSSTKVLGSTNLGLAGKALSGVPEWAGKALNSKAVRTGLRAATMAPALTAVPRVISSVYNDGFEYIKPADLKSIAVAGSVGKTWLNDIQAVRAVTRQATLGGSKAKTFIKLDGKEVPVSENLALPKDKKSLLQASKEKIGWGKKSGEKAKEAVALETEKFKAKLLEDLKAKNITLSEKQLKELQEKTAKDIKFQPAKSNGVYTLGRKAKNVTGNRNIDVRDYELAKKYLGKDAVRKIDPGVAGKVRRGKYNYKGKGKAEAKNEPVMSKELMRILTPEGRVFNMPSGRSQSTGLILRPRLGLPPASSSKRVIHIRTNEPIGLPAPKSVLELPEHQFPAGTQMKLAFKKGGVIKLQNPWLGAFNPKKDESNPWENALMTAANPKTYKFGEPINTNLRTAPLPITSDTSRPYIKRRGLNTGNSIQTSANANVKTTSMPVSRYSNTLTSTGLDYKTGLAKKADGTFTGYSQPATGDNYYGGVTNKLIAENWDPQLLKDAGLDPTKYSEWGKNAASTLQSYIIDNRPDLFRQLKDPTSKTSNLFGMDWYTLGVKPGDTPITTLKPLGIPATKIAVTPKEQVVSSTDVNTDVVQKAGLWDKLKGGINPTSIANLGMYAGTVAANRYIGDQQRQAVASGLYSLPYMPQTYMRIGSPNKLEADKQAAGVKSQAGRIATSSSDIDKGTAVRLQGEKQAAGIETQGQQLDLNRFDKLRGAQLENTARVDQYNTGVLGKNRGLTGEAFKNIHLINANQRLAQNTAFTNFVRAAERNYEVNKYKTAMADYWKAANDPVLKSYIDRYSKLAGDEGQAAARKLYDAALPGRQATTNYNKTFEQSSEYINWQKNVKDLETQLNLMMEPIRQKAAGLQHAQATLYMKKGGNLTKEEKLEIEQIKAQNRRNEKETEMAYKAIMHNNEMLQKALIKVFK